MCLLPTFKIRFPSSLRAFGSHLLSSCLFVPLLFSSWVGGTSRACSLTTLFIFVSPLIIISPNAPRAMCSSRTPVTHMLTIWRYLTALPMQAPFSHLPSLWNSISKVSVLFYLYALSLASSCLLLSPSKPLSILGVLFFLICPRL